ncbi:MAG: hypothetical protein ABH821_04845 [archaeon]
MDLAVEQELSMAVMNLIALEEHLAFTIARTKKDKYIGLYNAIRALRSKYLKKIIKNDEGELWCAAKHSLISTMHLMETGIKFGAQGKNKEAMEYFKDAIENYHAFWVMQELGVKEEKK